MGVAETVASDWLRDPIELGLAYQGRELTVGGYERQSGTVSVRRGRGSVTVRFGPFDSNVTYDEVVLYRDGREVDRRRQAGTVSLLAGMWIDHEAVFSFTDV